MVVPVAVRVVGREGGGRGGGQSPVRSRRWLLEHELLLSRATSIQSRLGLVMILPRHWDETGERVARVPELMRRLQDTLEQLWQTVFTVFGVLDRRVDESDVAWWVQDQARFWEALAETCDRADAWLTAAAGMMHVDPAGDLRDLVTAPVLTQPAVEVENPLRVRLRYPRDQDCSVMWTGQGTVDPERLCVCVSCRLCEREGVLPLPPPVSVQEATLANRVTRRCPCSPNSFVTVEVVRVPYQAAEIWQVRTNRDAIFETCQMETEERHFQHGFTAFFGKPTEQECQEADLSCAMPTVPEPAVRVRCPACHRVKAHVFADTGVWTGCACGRRYGLTIGSDDRGIFVTVEQDFE